MPYNPNYHTDYPNCNIPLLWSINLFRNVVQFPCAMTSVKKKSDKNEHKKIKSSFSYPNPLPARGEENHGVTSKRSVLAKADNASTNDRTTLLPVPSVVMYDLKDDVALATIFKRQLKQDITSSDRHLQLTLGQNFFVRTP